MVVSCVADKPRVISELKKTNLPKRKLTATSSLDDHGQSKISGELLWSATPTQWHVKFAEVRHGILFVYCSDTGTAEFRLPLHHLNLQPSRTPRTFTLATGHGIPLATFQAQTEEEFDQWVRVLAVEVLRQTPIQDVRFLDIIGITLNEKGMRRGRSEECLSSTSRSFWEPTDRKNKRNKYNFREECKTKKKERSEFSQWLHCVKRESREENLSKNVEFDMKNMKIRRAQRVRPKLPFAEMWKHIRGVHSTESVKTVKARSVSLENLKVLPEEPVLIEPSAKFTPIQEKKEIISDESGISSGDENNNTINEVITNDPQVQDLNVDILTADTQSEQLSFVSVREKKRFFESLGGENFKPTACDVTLNRSNSIGNVSSMPSVTNSLRKSQRANSMQNLSGNSLPVKEMRRLFEKKDPAITQSCENLAFANCILEKDEEISQSPKTSRKTRIVERADDVELVKPVERKPKDSVNYANVQFCGTMNKRFKCIEEESECSSRGESSAENQPLESSEAKSSSVDVINNVREGGGSTTSTLLIQRKLQRGERKLGKLRIQIAEVEDTIKMIAEDLQSIGPDTLKKRKGLEVFAALRRRLEEETSRLERLQEETAKVIGDNQRTILKMTTARSAK